MRCLTVVSLLAVLLLESSFADAIRKTTNIPAQDLRSALNMLAKDHDLHVVYRSEIVGALSTRGVAGDLTTDEALDRLLDGTGLTFRYLNDKTVTVELISSVNGSVSSAATPAAESSMRLAESSTAAAPQQVQGEGRSEGSASADALHQPEISEIVVTAQKRVERLQDVPISISVLNGDELDRSTTEGITEVLNRVPGVATNVFSLQGGGTVVAIRGVSASGPVFNGSSPVSYYLDSVPFGLVKSAIAPDANAYDMERVEVLRGPQGTLYGASALNGVVRVLTKDANLSEFELKGRGSTASTSDGDWSHRGDLAINVPIIEGKVAARAVAGYQGLGGWIDKTNDRDANDAEVRNMRLKVNAQPREELSIGLSAWLSRADYSAPMLSDADSKRIGIIVDEPMLTDYDVYGLKIGYEFPSLSVTSSTSYLDYENGGSLGLIPFSPLMLFTGFESQVFAQEVTLNSKQEGPWRWTLGGIYRDAEDRLLQGVVPIIPMLLDESDVSESFAVFGELTRFFLDGQFELTAGLRYFEDDVTHKENQRHFGAVTPDLFERDQTFDAVTPRFVVAWHPSQDMMVYGSYAEGFRSGFDQYASVALATSTLGLPPAEPDTLKNYELGAKGTLLGGRIGFDTALYYLDWEGVQQSILVLAPGNARITAGVNGESASGAGFDFGITARPLEGLELGAHVSWNDLAMDSTLVSGGIVLFEPGDRLNLSSEYTVGTSMNYSFPLGARGFRGEFSASANYTSEPQFRSISGDARIIASGEAMLIGRTSFSIRAPDRWALTFFADNVNDERGTPLRSPFNQGARDAMRVRPRTIGVQLEYRY